MSEFTVNRDASVYYATGYWNDLPQVQAYMERRVSGRPGVPWHQHLREQAGRTFAKALVLNCGNGWVERELLASGLVAEAVGVDISPDLLDQAREAAAEGGLPLRYYELDINTARLPETGYDLVVNYAAAHHIAYLDKVFRAVAALLPDDGVFVSSDYVGAHRNQYPYADWAAACDLNRALPEPFRHVLPYPHLPTMLAGDPTEAIHAELILDTYRRYFGTEAYAAMGGALAYPVLTFNGGIHGSSGPARDAAIEQVVAADEAYLEAHPESTLFAYFWGRPRRDVDPADLARWTAEEDEREEAAAKNGGEYYPLTPWQEVTQEVDLLRVHNAHLRADLDRAGHVRVLPPSVRRTLVATMERRTPRLTKALVRAKHAVQRSAR